MLRCAARCSVVRPTARCAAAAVVPPPAVVPPRAAVGSSLVARCVVSRRACSTVTTNGGESGPAAKGKGDGDFDLPSEDPIDTLLNEIEMLTYQPMPIGTLFKTMSPESRKFLVRERMPLETFLLRHPRRFTVYKEHHKSGVILVARSGGAPEGAMRGAESTVDRIFDGSQPRPDQNAGRGRGRGRGGRGDRGGRGVWNRELSKDSLFAVLRYIPNEWSSYVLLDIPDDVKRDIIRKPAKRFFDSHPKYFEVTQQQGHTFEVRRSLELRAQSEQQPQDQS